MSIRNILVRTWAFLKREKYCIGFVTLSDIKSSNKEWYKKVEWIDDSDFSKTSWFADPFILSVSQDNIELLAEEYIYSNHKGRLSHLLIQRKMGKYYIKKVTPILELNTHLSFPLIYQENGMTYIMPENCESGCLYLYKYNKDTKSLDDAKLLIKEPLVDSSVMKLENRYFIMGTLVDGAYKDPLESTKFLHVYYSKQLLGPYTEIQIISNNCRNERGAGQIFSNNGTYYRPAQCCEERYGKNVIIYKLNFDSNCNLSEEVAARIEPDYSHKNSRCLHTFNMLDNMIVIDGRKYLHHYIAHCLIDPIEKLYYGIKR